MNIRRFFKKRLRVKVEPDHHGRTKNRGWLASIYLSFLWWGREKETDRPAPPLVPEKKPDRNLPRPVPQKGSVIDSFVASVTGYYTPIETDYLWGVRANIMVDGNSYGTSEKFLEVVRMEGWGKTREGWYLGYWGGRYHRSSSAMNSRGRALTINQVAVSRPRLGQRLRIPKLPGKFGRTTFIATDVGSAIEGDDIDVYCGEGEDARRMSYSVTGKAIAEVVI